MRLGQITVLVWLLSLCASCAPRGSAPPKAVAGGDTRVSMTGQHQVEMPDGGSVIMCDIRGTKVTSITARLDVFSAGEKTTSTVRWSFDPRAVEIRGLVVISLETGTGFGQPDKVAPSIGMKISEPPSNGTVDTDVHTKVVELNRQGDHLSANRAIGWDGPQHPQRPAEDDAESQAKTAQQPAAAKPHGVGLYTLICAPQNPPDNLTAGFVATHAPFDRDLLTFSQRGFVIVRATLEGQ